MHFAMCLDIQMPMETKKEQLLKLILDHPEIVEFGQAEDSPEDKEVSFTEKVLGVSLPPSYIWFLNTFGGGEVCGDEITSIYKDHQTPSGDMVYLTRLFRESQTINDHDVHILSTDFGELFVLNTSLRNAKSESPVEVIRGSHRNHYADDFLSFALKYIAYCIDSGKN